MPRVSGTDTVYADIKSVQLLYSSEILGPKCALKKRAHACSFFKRTQKTRAKEVH